MIDPPACDEGDVDLQMQLESPVGIAERELETAKDVTIIPKSKPMIDCPIFDGYSVDDVRQLEELVDDIPSHELGEIVSISSLAFSLCCLSSPKFEDAHNATCIFHSFLKRNQ